ncbi:MAG: energy transducer TonB [Candidatus Angelobacter sp.]
MIQLQELKCCRTCNEDVLAWPVRRHKRTTLYMIANFSNRALHLLRLTFFVLIATLLWNTYPISTAFSQTTQAQSGTRKVKSSVPPEYPELARKMKIEGVARVLLTVSSEGSVVKIKELGGNPVLVNALAQAAHKWKYESTDHESEIEVRYEFVLRD